LGVTGVRFAHPFQLRPPEHLEEAYQPRQLQISVGDLEPTPGKTPKTTARNAAKPTYSNPRLLKRLPSAASNQLRHRRGKVDALESSTA
jgi:hypothetical protein